MSLIVSAVLPGSVPPAFASAHLANSASLLLPVSNLTNLLAFAGVNVGPNLTYVGWLATLLWRQILHAPDAGDFLRLGALTVPLTLVAGVLTLWLSLRFL